jgi:hypothetical protein
MSSELSTEAIAGEAENKNATVIDKVVRNAEEAPSGFPNFFRAFMVQTPSTAASRLGRPAAGRTLLRLLCGSELYM